MDTNQNIFQNDDKEDNNQSPSEETNPSTGDQANQPAVPEGSPPPRDKKEGMSGARILRDLFAEVLNVPGWSKIREKLNEFEDTLEDKYHEGGK